MMPNAAPARAGELRQIPALAVIHEWPRVAHLVRSALEHGEHSYDEADVAFYCMRGDWQLWLAEEDGGVEAIGVTELVNFPRQRKCVIRYLAGTLDAILPHLPALRAWAKEQGCALLEGYGREGWEKVMPGWTKRYVVLQEEL